MEISAKTNCKAALKAAGYVLLLGVCAAAAGCGKVERAPASGGGKAMEIRQGTTASFGELRIGLSSLRDGEYAGPAGEKKSGLEAVLVLFIKGEPPQEKRFDAHIGETLNLGKYSVYVQEIKGGDKGSVRLEVKTAD